MKKMYIINYYMPDYRDSYYGSYHEEIYFTTLKDVVEKTRNIARRGWAEEVYLCEAEVNKVSGRIEKGRPIFEMPKVRHF